LNKALLLIPLILSIGIISVLPLSFSQTQELEECRDGLIIVFLTNANTFSCKTPETAERWVELGLAVIVDPNYVPPVEEPKGILEVIEEVTPEIIIPIPFDQGVQINNASDTGVENSPPKDNPGKAPDHSNANEKPGTPRKVGQQGVVASGYVVIDVYDKNGNLKSHNEDHNLVVDNGLETLADLAFGTTHSTGESAGAFVNISVGSSGTAPASGQTDCLTQNGNKKADASVTNTALGAIINVSWIAELPAVSLQEICLTDSVTNSTGNLFSRQTYTAIPITATDTVNAEWTITFADSNGT
jgi:hypothetical protein